MAKTVRIEGGKVHYAEGAVGGNLATFCGRHLSGKFVKQRYVWTLNEGDAVDCWPCQHIYRQRYEQEPTT